MVIPKTFHFIWIGDQLMPDFAKKIIGSWVMKHPSWNLVIWDNKRVEKTFLKQDSTHFMFNEQAYLDCQIWAQKSDILRYEILFWFGGVYLDVDVFCFKNIEDIIKDEKAFTCWSYKPIYCIENAIIGSIPYTKTMWNAILGAGNGIRHCKDDVLQSTGPYMLKTIWTNDDNIKKLDHDYFLNHLLINDFLDGNINLSNHPEIHSVHFCLSSWHSKERYDYQFEKIKKFIKDAYV